MCSSDLRFAEVAAALQRELDLAVVVLRPPAAVAPAIAAGSSLPALPLDAVLAVLGRALLFVGNDSGPAHMAAAVGTPTVTVFGSQNPRVWRPWGAASAHRALSAGLPCSPCPGFRCGNDRQLACLDDVTAAQVTDAAREVLAHA